jgi:predicted ATPase
MAKVFVNRKFELERLDSSLNEASGGSPTFVFISGEAGVGKAELVDHFFDQRETALVPFSYGATRQQRTIPYHAFTGFLDRFSKMDERDLGDEASARLTKILGMLGSKTSLVGDVAKEREVLFDAFAQFFQSVSRERVIALHIDNFQWCDEGSILLVQHLAQNLEGCRLLFLVSYRPEELEETADTVHPITGLMATLMMQDRLNTVMVERFGRDRTGEMLAALLGIEEMPETFLDFIYGETEGSPMYITGLVGDMLESGIIDLSRPHWAEEFDPEEVRTPGGVKDIISRRLDHVDEELHDVLRVASVLDATFSIADLAALTECDSKELSRSMSEAVERQILFEVLDASEESYSFDHTKIRAVLYESLEPSRKKQLHGKMGGILEARNRPLELAYLLAHHFSEAGDLSRGYRYARLSGNLALGSHAPTEAYGYYNSALRLITDSELLKELPKERVELLILIGEVGYTIGKWDEAVKSLENAVISSRELGDDLLMVNSLIALGDIIRFKAVTIPAVSRCTRRRLRYRRKPDSTTRWHRSTGAWGMSGGARASSTRPRGIIISPSRTRRRRVTGGCSALRTPNSAISNRARAT